MLSGVWFNDVGILSSPYSAHRPEVGDWIGRLDDGGIRIVPVF